MKLLIWDFLNTIYDGNRDDFLEDALELLEGFHGKHKQILVSSTKHLENRIHLIQRFGLDKYFTEIVISAKTKELFEDLITKHGEETNEVYIIGDLYEKEIQIGNELGVKTIWLRDNDEDAGYEYWKKIKRLKELEEILS